MSVRLWTAQLDRPLADGEVTRLLAWLPSQRRERLLRMNDPKKREAPLCAWGLLRWAVREIYGLEQLPEIEWTPLGKPYFPAYPHIYFNMSHTDGAVLVALADVPVGVDIEKIRPISQRMLRWNEAAASEEFFSTWARKEAQAKCSGRGVAEFLNSEPTLRAEERYEPIETFPGYAAGAAYCGDAQVIETQKLIWSRDLCPDV